MEESAILQEVEVTKFNEAIKILDEQSLKNGAEIATLFGTINNYNEKLDVFIKIYIFLKDFKKEFEKAS